MKINRSKMILAGTILILIAVYQNCNKTTFTTATEGTEVAASTETPETEDNAPVTQPPPPTIPRTAPPTTTSTTSPAVYSTCQSKTATVSCPDNRPNCTCTGTLPAGRYIQGSTVPSPSPDRTKNGTGPNCSIQVPDGSENTSHSGTVVSLEYGTCTNYCSVTAKCINGDWQQLGSTW